MATSSSVGSHKFSDVAERQMRMWALGMESQRQLEKQRAAASPKRLIHPYIAISRESGVDAGEIAQLVAAKKGWKVLDRGILDYMAENYHWSRIALEFVDERTASWFHETFGKWLDKQLVSQAEYVSRLGKLVLLAAQHESTVFVGRGTQFLLPREAGLAVRIIAPRKQRIERLMKLKKLNARDAERHMDATDSERAQFVDRYFHHDVSDPHLYDLVLNLAQLSREEVVKLIVEQCKRVAAK